MLSLTAIWFCLKRTPRFLALSINLISIILTVVLLLGCYNEKNLSIFLVKYTFDPKSPFYSVIENSFKSSNNSVHGLQTVSIKSGYMGVCLSNLPNKTDPVCYPRKNLVNTTFYDDLSIELFNIKSITNSTIAKSGISIKLNILQLAQLTATEILHPYLLMVTIIFSIIMFLLILYVLIPGFPKKYFVNRFLLIWTTLLTLMWGFGTMWTHVAINTSSELVPRASLGIISTKRGIKAETMSWFAFSFLLIDSLVIWFLYFRDRKKLSDEIDKVNASNRYVSDSSTFSSKG